MINFCFCLLLSGEIRRCKGYLCKKYVRELLMPFLIYKISNSASSQSKPSIYQRENRSVCNCGNIKTVNTHIDWVVCIFCYWSESWEARPHYPGEIWKRHFHTEKASNAFHSHYTPVILDLRFEGNSRSRGYRDVNVFLKAPFSKCFPFRLKRQARVFKILGFEEGFPRALLP